MTDEGRTRDSRDRDSRDRDSRTRDEATDGDDSGRTTAERTTLAASCLVLGAVVALIVAQMLQVREPPAPVARVSGPVRTSAGLHHVPVLLTNGGDDTAADVVVEAELEVDGEVSTAEQTVDFLAGGEQEDLVFVFEEDPASGELTVTVTGYAEP